GWGRGGGRGDAGAGHAERRAGRPRARPPAWCETFASRAPRAAGECHPRRALLLAEDDDHDDRMPRPLEHLVWLEAEEPLHELEASRQLDHGLQLLREHHAREVGLTIDAARAVLDGLERHALAEHLRHRI